MNFIVIQRFFMLQRGEFGPLMFAEAAWVSSLVEKPLRRMPPGVLSKLSNSFPSLILVL
jgi:hypothetical protein